MEHVLHIRGGIGLLDNYGLLSTLTGNAIFPYLARLYYECVCRFGESKAVKHARVVRGQLLRLRSMVLLRGRFRFSLYGLLFVGAAFWIANTSIHLFGNVEAHWGHKVFDSVDHPANFYLNRLNNFYTWIIVLPFCGHVIIFCTLQCVRTIKMAADRKAICYDLLNPDRCGGFLPVERAHTVLNVIMAILYVQISLHTETFSRMNAEHAIAYAGATVVLLFGNSLFMGSAYQAIKRLRIEALNDRKERVYQNDALSFEILKFFYETRATRFGVINFATKAVAIIVSALIKSLPTFFETSRSFILV